MKVTKILVADDDRTLRKGIRFELEDADYQVSEAATVQQAFDLLKKHSFDLVITDLKIPEIADGMKIVVESKKIDSNTMVMVITGYGSIELAVQAMKAGADDFVTKDASVTEIKLKVEKLLQQHNLNLEHARIREENRRLRAELEKKYQFENLIGNSKIFQDTLKLVGKVAEDGHCTVLLQGESGTGKEVIARAIHYNSPRREKPYVIVNVAAVPDTLLESELFGHVKGAFTDARKDRDGKFKLADGGTLFLDEIGDMPVNLQAKLLRVLQDKTFEPLGSDTTMTADVRIIAATNQDLQQRVRENTFREDLYYRLNVVPIKLPPLRARKEDIPILASHFLQEFCQERKKDLRLSSEVLDCFLRYDWPGNIRQLENIIEQIVVLSTEGQIEYKNFPEIFKQFTTGEKISKIENLAAARATIIKDFEREFITNALNRHAWNVSQTARAIGVSREGLHRMMKKYGLKKE
ncbi:MAG: sigma-54-dependent transcriptional regulator [bacterium]